jgi:hypothetical protein
MSKIVGLESLTVEFYETLNDADQKMKEKVKKHPADPMRLALPYKSTCLMNRDAKNS